MADFMQDQITEKQTWLRVETTQGTEFVPASLVGFVRNKVLSTCTRCDVKTVPNGDGLAHENGMVSCSPSARLPQTAYGP